MSVRWTHSRWVYYWRPEDVQCRVWSCWDGSWESCKRQHLRPSNGLNGPRTSYFQDKSIHNKSSQSPNRWSASMLDYKSPTSTVLSLFTLCKYPATVKCLFVQIPSRSNLCVTWTATEAPRPDRVWHGDPPSSGSPANQLHVSPSWDWNPHVIS